MLARTLTAVALLLAFAGPAEARTPHHPPRARITKGIRWPAVTGPAAPLVAPYIASAEAYWRRAPACRAIVAVYRDDSPGATGGHCIITINAAEWATEQSWWHCPVIAHEYGHVLGLAHTDDPASVMYGGDGPVWDGYTVPGMAGC